VPFADLEPLTLFAREIRGAPVSGLSEPLFVECADADGDRHNVVLKLLNPMTPDRRPWNLCLVRDLVGSILARRLGLLVPNYALVQVGDAFAASAARHDAGRRISANIGMNFGSVRVDSVLEEGCNEAEFWEGPMSFDALSFNADRLPSNPNVLWTGKALYLIDHGMVAPT
jgi:hypothetical protein